MKLSHQKPIGLGETLSATPTPEFKEALLAIARFLLDKHDEVFQDFLKNTPGADKDTEFVAKMTSPEFKLQSQEAFLFAQNGAVMLAHEVMAASRLVIKEGKK